MSPCQSLHSEIPRIIYTPNFIFDFTGLLGSDSLFVTLSFFLFFTSPPFSPMNDCAAPALPVSSVFGSPPCLTQISHNNSDSDDSVQPGNLRVRKIEVCPIKMAGSFQRVPPTADCVDTTRNNPTLIFCPHLINGE